MQVYYAKRVSCTKQSKRKIFSLVVGCFPSSEEEGISRRGLPSRLYARRETGEGFLSYIRVGCVVPSDPKDFNLVLRRPGENKCGAK